MKTELTISSYLESFRTGQTKSSKLIESCLQKAEELDSTLGVFLHQDAAKVRQQAQGIDKNYAIGTETGALAGIPIGIKDNYYTSDAPTTAQSLIPDPNEPHPDATAVKRLRDAGAVFMGKTSTMEFALGFSDPEKPFPTPKNPWDTNKWTGGSSSGTASGIQSGMFLAGLGSDTAGSIRMPAAWCGVSGHKPTYGLVPRTGVIPLAWTMDHAGPLARTAEDCSYLLEIIAGPDGIDCSVKEGASYSHSEIGLDLRSLRIGVAMEPMENSIPEVQALVREAATTLTNLGATVTDIRLPLYDETIDAVMFGLAAEAFNYHQRNAAKRWEEYGAATRSALLTGTLVSGNDYLQTLRVRKHVQRLLNSTFDEVDLIIAPTATRHAPDVDSLDFNEVVGMLQTHYWNGTGNPALSVPMGFVAGMPVGLQIVGPRFADKAVLDLGRIWQQHTNHHLQEAGL